METKLLNQKGEEVGKVQLPEKVFGVKPSGRLLHEMSTAYQANQREGSAHTKTRAEVSGGGRKPWKQKHTGRARHGSIRSPLWRKGGIVFGPRNQTNWHQDPPRRKTRQALAHALSARAADGGLRVVDSLSLDGAKTKQVAALLAALKAEGRSVLVTEQHDANLVRASRNIQDVSVAVVSHLNVYDVLSSRNVVITKGALEKLAPRWS